MKLEKHLRILVRIRDYETVQVEVGAEISDEDLDKRPADLDTTMNHMQLILSRQLDTLLRAELENATRWSEIHPNLADNYLSTYVQRDQRARSTDGKTTHTAAPASRRIRRRGPADSQTA